MRPRWFPLLFVFSLAVLAYAQDFSGVEIHTIPVRGSTYMLEGVGGNIGLSIGKDGVLMIDSQFAPLSEKIEAAIRNAGGGKVAFLVNTHWHGDHTGGNEFFGRTATIIAHTNVRKRLITDQNLPNRKVPAKPPEAWPLLTFEEGVTLHFNGEAIEVIHFPNGHTDGDSVVFFKGSNVVHLGDLFFSGRFPFIDLDSGGNVAGYIQNVATLLERIPEDALLIPGHGPLSTRKELATFHEMLVETSRIVRERIESGASLEEIRKAGLPERWKGWGEGFVSTDRWIEILYQSFAHHSKSMER